jgi:FkbM family methyltransferase
MKPTFLEALSSQLLTDSEADARVDRMRFPGLVPEMRAPSSEANLVFVLENLAEYEAGWNLFVDEPSQALFVKILCQRIRGAEHVRLPLDPDSYWRAHDEVSSLSSEAQVTDAGTDFVLGVYDLRRFGFEFSARCHLLNVLDTFALRQYEIHRPCGAVAARPGDFVIDGGAAWGDTALYFADKVGTAGRVVAVEFVEENLAVLYENLALNPRLAARIEIESSALWDTSGEELGYSMAGPGTSVSSGVGESRAHTVSIDDLVIHHRLPTVNFIKMDVEGAELHALQGARATIEHFRPHLAISAYHRPMDLTALPQWINDLGLGYRFFLDHFTSHQEETVLFATSD